MEKIAMWLLQIVTPVFVFGYAFGWLETMQYTSQSVKYDPDTILSLWEAVLLQIVSMIGIAASLFAFAEGDESFLGSLMGSISMIGISIFYVLYSTPYMILALIMGLNFPYIFCFATWSVPLIALFSLKILTD